MYSRGLLSSATNRDSLGVLFILRKGRVARSSNQASEDFRHFIEDRAQNQYRRAIARAHQTIPHSPCGNMQSRVTTRSTAETTDCQNPGKEADSQSVQRRNPSDVLGRREAEGRTRAPNEFLLRRTIVGLGRHGVNMPQVVIRGGILCVRFGGPLVEESHLQSPPAGTRADPQEWGD